MIAAADLHLHSCLSPCGDADMTPNNIANMAQITGLDVIAVTDHNSGLNLPAVQSVCGELGLVLLPGIEACSAEEVHTLLYFPDVDSAVACGKALREHLPDMPNNPRFFGDQQVMDDQDEVIGTEDRLLIQSLDLDLDALASLGRSFGALVVPAHINKGANSLLINLGFIPPGAPFAALEITKTVPMPPVDISGWSVLHSSDAHMLQDIAERTFFIDIEEKTTAAAYDAILRGRVGVKGE